MAGKKFMQVLENPPLQILKTEAKRRRITLQELIRAVVIPEWFKKEQAKQKRKVGRRR